METGATTEFFDTPPQPDTKAPIGAVPAPDPEDEKIRDHVALPCRDPETHAVRQRSGRSMPGSGTGGTSGPEDKSNRNEENPTTGNEKTLKRAQSELRDADDFAPREPMAGLVRDDIRENRFSRRAAGRLLAAGGALSLAHVRPGLRPQPALADDHSEGELRAAWGGLSEIVTLAPARINQVLQFQIAQIARTFLGLMHINDEPVAKGDLAEGRDALEDGLIYSIKLRERVTFHNGDAFDAQGVLFTLNRSSDPERSIHSRVLANATSLVKLNDLEVRFKLAQPRASFLTKALDGASGPAMTITSRGTLQAMGPAQCGPRPVGTGPLRIVEHRCDGPVVMARFETYFDPERPTLDRMVITPVDGT